MYKCKQCKYTSKRLFDLRRHENRKTSCFTGNTHNYIIENDHQSNGYIKQEKNVSPDKKNVSPDEENVSPDKKNVSPDEENVSPEEELVSPAKEKVIMKVCQRCNKKLCNTQSYNYHIQICNGYDPKTCPTCLRKFASHRGRWKHTRTVKCVPPPPPTSSNAQKIINNTTNNINIVNSQNINVNLNFGQEALDKLCSHPDYLKRMDNVVRLGKYALPQHLSDIYFNESFPMNNTIMKTRRNDRFVKIKTGENEWNLRAMDDVYQIITQRMESYMNPYFKYVGRQMEKIYDEDQQKFKSLTRSIREFGHKVLWLDWNCNDIRQIGVELNDPYCENERHRRIQEMKTLLLEHIYDKTKEMLDLN
jgi:hypothetical protein